MKEANQQSERALPPRYAQWQEILARAFLGAHPGVPLVFFVDDDELRRLAPGSTNPAGDLAAAVAELVYPQRGAAMFAALGRATARWDSSAEDQPPATLPVLALSVLAATRMHTDEQARSSNYYLRLAQALLPGAPAADVDATRLALRGGAFIAVAKMWQDFDRWLGERGGSAGISTIRDHPEHTRIGFPLSQALVRRSDRAALTRFFEALEISQLGVPSSDALLEYLRIWAARPRGLGEAFRRLLADDTLRPLLQPLVRGLAETWDGRVVTMEGLTHLDIAVVLDLERWAAWWAIPGGRGPAHDTLVGTIAGIPVEIAITRDPYSGLFRLSGVPVVNSQALHDGVRLRGATCVAELAPIRILVLSEDSDAGGWLSTRSIVPFREHVIAASADLANDVECVLQRAAKSGWRRVRQPAERPLLAGYVLFLDIIFDDPDELDDALATVPALLSAAIRPDSTTRARLVNGLPLARPISRDCYLAGAEPDLLLPVGDLRRFVDATLDGTEQDPPFLASGFPIELRRIGPLLPGLHVIEADRDNLRFTVLRTNPSTHTSGTAELGWDGQGEIRADLAEPMVCGAAVEGQDAFEPLLVRRGPGRVWLIHKNGHCSSVIEPPPVVEPLSQIRGFSGYYFELNPPRSAAWLAEQRGSSWKMRGICRQEPEFASLDVGSRLVWSALALHGPDGDPLWQLYLRAWEQSRGR